MKRVDKRILVAALREQIAREIEAMKRAARDAAEAATHEEAKPENDKDTRGLEASYLARGQAERVRELERDHNALQFLALRDLGEGEAIRLGALVEVSAEEAEVSSLYFISPAGGGMRAKASGADVLVVTPQSPLGQALVGKSVGDVVQIRARAGARELEIVDVR